MSRDTLLKLIPVLVAFVLLALFPAVATNFYVDQALKIMVLAIFALSLELLVGQTGLVCFGQAAFFGIAAYCVALLTPKSGPASLWWLLPLSMLSLPPARLPILLPTVTWQSTRTFPWPWTTRRRILRRAKS